MIEPGSFASISRSATACATKKAARTLSAMMTSKSSTLTSGRQRRAVGAGIVDQDLNGSARGQRRLRRLDVGHVEHQRLGLLAARADRRGGVLDLGLAVRAASVTCAPASASAEAAASPMPRPAPVTSARLPSRRKEGVLARSTLIVAAAALSLP